MSAKGRPHSITGSIFDAPTEGNRAEETPTEEERRRGRLVDVLATASSDLEHLIAVHTGYGCRRLEEGGPLVLCWGSSDPTGLPFDRCFPNLYTPVGSDRDGATFFDTWIKAQPTARVEAIRARMLDEFTVPPETGGTTRIDEVRVEARRSFVDREIERRKNRLSTSINEVREVLKVYVAEAIAWWGRQEHPWDPESPGEEFTASVSALYYSLVHSGEVGDEWPDGSDRLGRLLRRYPAAEVVTRSTCAGVDHYAVEVCEALHEGLHLEHERGVCQDLAAAARSSTLPAVAFFPRLLASEHGLQRWPPLAEFLYAADLRTDKREKTVELFAELVDGSPTAKAFCDAPNRRFDPGSIDTTTIPKVLKMYREKKENGQLEYAPLLTEEI